MSDLLGMQILNSFGNSKHVEFKLHLLFFNWPGFELINSTIHTQFHYQIYMIFIIQNPIESGNIRVYTYKMITDTLNERRNVSY